MAAAILPGDVVPVPQSSSQVLRLGPGLVAQEESRVTATHAGLQHASKSNALWLEGRRKRWVGARGARARGSAGRSIGRGGLLLG